MWFGAGGVANGSHARFEPGHQGTKPFGTGTSLQRQLVFGGLQLPKGLG